MERKLSCPAVSQICSLTTAPASISTSREPNSTPGSVVRGMKMARRTRLTDRGLGGGEEAVVREPDEEGGFPYAQRLGMSERFSISSSLWSERIARASYALDRPV